MRNRKFQQTGKEKTTASENSDKRDRMRRIEQKRKTVMYIQVA